MSLTVLASKLMIMLYLPAVCSRCTKVKEGLKRAFFPSPLCLSCTFFSFALSDSADVESLSQDSSDEENEEREEEDQKAGVTSMDEALRTVTDIADSSQEDIVKQNSETLAESCSMGRRGQTLTCNFEGIDKHFGKNT